ncbi:MAG: response regulator [Candidatus Gastranaerophilales bacterium]|nr:response regulator [Candidatus Gastranaerophilales bacterium]
MKSLVVDDDFTCRRILQAYLSKFGECHIAVNGQEALDAFKASLDDNEPYDVITLDIMMPEMNGHEVLKKIREIEDKNGKFGIESVKIIMTTALDDSENIKHAFREQCEAYLVKPIDRQKLMDKLSEFGLR